MTGLLKRLYVNETLRHGALVMMAMTLGNLAAFGFHAVVSRHLGVASYGALYALVSFASLVTLPVGFLPTVVARYAAEFRSLTDDRHMRALTRFVAHLLAGVSLGFVLVLGALAVPLSRFLHVSPWLILPTALLAAASTISPMLRAVLQGEGDFNGFSLASGSEGFGKLFFGSAAAFAGLGTGFCLAGFAMGNVAGASISAVRLWRRLGGAQRVPFRIDWRRVMQTSGGAIAIAVATAVLTSSDVILVKHYFPAHLAGLYAAASLGGKIMLFAVGFASAVLLPKATQRHARGERTRGALTGAGTMLAVVSAVGLLLVAIAGPLILRALVGIQFVQAAPLLFDYAVAMTLLAATNLLASYALAVHRLTFMIPLVVTSLAEPFGISLFHATLQQVIVVLIVANALALAATALALYIDSLNERRSLA